MEAVPFVVSILVLGTFVGCRNAPSGNFGPLVRQSAQNQVALLASRGSAIGVLPFGQRSHYYTAPFSANAVVIAPDGKSIVWIANDLEKASQPVYREEISTGKRALIKMPVNRFWIIAVAPSRMLLEYTIDGQKDETRMGWMEDSVASLHELGSNRGIVDVAWSGSGSELFFGFDGRMMLLDIASNKRSDLGGGINASLSPDDSQLIFSLGQGDYRVRSLLSGASRNLISRDEIEGRVRWSPDSRFFLTTEKVRKPFPWIGTYYRRKIYRVEDLSSMTLKNYGLLSEAFGLSNFEWISSWKTFCNACQKGSTFD